MGQRTTDEGASRLMNAAISAASLGEDKAPGDYRKEDTRSNQESIGKTSATAWSPEHYRLDPFDNSHQTISNVAKGRGKARYNRVSEPPPGEVEGARRRGAG